MHCLKCLSFNLGIAKCFGPLVKGKNVAFLRVITIDYIAFAQCTAVGCSHDEDEKDVDQHIYLPLINAF